jgi:hypothetical protein
MRGQIKLTTRRELTAAISQRYRAADRNEKKLILYEFVKVTGYLLPPASVSSEQ